MFYISKQKLEELKNELKERKTVTRQQISARIQEAQTQGETAENAEYDDAKEAQAVNERRIMKLEKLTTKATLIPKKKTSDTIQIGSKILVKDGNNKKFEFTIFGPEDANPIEGKISNESPLGIAFLGHKQKDEVEVITPRGKVKYTIIKIK